MSRVVSLVAIALLPLVGFAQDKKPDLPQIAHFRLSGSLGEAPAAEDPLLGSLSESFRDKLTRLEKAAQDDKVKGLFLHVDGLAIGWGKVHELSRAIAKVRKAGKKTFAYLEGGSTYDYLIGLACDQVFMPESGWLLLTGMRMEMSFYKELFDKIGVKADMLRMGDYKGAAEPYTRTSMSSELRKQLSGFLDDMYEGSLVQRIVQGRPQQKWDAEKVMEIIDNGPYTASAAKKAGLIDKVLYDDELTDLFQKSLKADKVEVVKEYGKKKKEELDFSNPFALFKLLAPRKTKPSKNPKIAVIYAVGVINTGKGGIDIMGGEQVGSTTMVKAIRQAEKDETVKAIVLRVDSPGGSALASDLIWNALKQCKKPVIASMGDTAASGGYYISMAAQKIFAEPGTLTGSIGVVGGKIAIGGVYEKVGITTDVISRGKNAGILSTNRGFNASERKAMQALMEEVYAQFLNKALEGRKQAGKKMTLAELKKLAGGRIWTGRQALEHRLVDELGTLDDAIAEAKKRAGLSKDEKTELLVLPKPRSFLTSLLEGEGIPGLMASQARKSVWLREVSRRLGSVEGMLRLRHEPVWTVIPFSIKVK